MNCSDVYNAKYEALVDSSTKYLCPDFGDDEILVGGSGNAVANLNMIVATCYQVNYFTG